MQSGDSTSSTQAEDLVNEEEQLDAYDFGTDGTSEPRREDDRDRLPDNYGGRNGSHENRRNFNGNRHNFRGNRRNSHGNRRGSHGEHSSRPSSSYSQDGPNRSSYQARNQQDRFRASSPRRDRNHRHDDDGNENYHGSMRRGDRSARNENNSVDDSTHRDNRSSSPCRSGFSGRNNSSPSGARNRSRSPVRAQSPRPNNHDRGGQSRSSFDPDRRHGRYSPGEGRNNRDRRYRSRSRSSHDLRHGDATTSSHSRALQSRRPSSSSRQSGNDSRFGRLEQPTPKDDQPELLIRGAITRNVPQDNAIQAGEPISRGAATTIVPQDNTVQAGEPVSRGAATTTIVPEDNATQAVVPVGRAERLELLRQKLNSADPRSSRVPAPSSRSSIGRVVLPHESYAAEADELVSAMSAAVPRSKTTIAAAASQPMIDDIHGADDLSRAKEPTNETALHGADVTPMDLDSQAKAVARLSPSLGTTSIIDTSEEQITAMATSGAGPSLTVSQSALLQQNEIDKQRAEVKKRREAKKQREIEEEQAIIAKYCYDEGSESDDSDMFADPDEPKPKKQKKTKNLGPIKAKPLERGVDTDDHQAYYKFVLHELIHGRYHVVERLGKGSYATVFRALDTKEHHKVVALKIIRKNAMMAQEAGKEIAVLQKIQEWCVMHPEDAQYMVGFEGNFVHRGHVVMVFENMGYNLRDAMDPKKGGFQKGMDIQTIKKIAFQLFTALRIMKDLRLVHGDLKPDNILMNPGEKLEYIKLADFGTAFKNRNHQEFDIIEMRGELGSRFYRPPEVMLGMDWGYGMDVWAAGVTLFEMFTGTILFQGSNNNSMLYEIQKTMGQLHHKYTRTGIFSQEHFDNDVNNTFHLRQVGTTGMEDRMLVALGPRGPKDPACIHLRLKAHAKEPGSKGEEEEIALLAKLIEGCLVTNHNKRWGPKEALDSEFIAGKAVVPVPASKKPSAVRPLFTPSSVGAKVKASDKARVERERRARMDGQYAREAEAAVAAEEAKKRAAPEEVHEDGPAKKKGFRFGGFKPVAQ